MSNTDKKDLFRKILTNKRAFYDFEIIERFEGGIVLMGTEIKSIRNGQTSFKDSYIDVVKGELFVLNWMINPYDKGGYVNHEPERPKKLLLHKKEITRLAAKILQKGLTLIPLSLYFKGQHLKMEIALASGKKQYDKRDAITRREAQREMERAFKHNR